MQDLKVLIQGAHKLWAPVDTLSESNNKNDMFRLEKFSDALEAVGIGVQTFSTYKVVEYLSARQIFK